MSDLELIEVLKQLEKLSSESLTVFAKNTTNHNLSIHATVLSMKKGRVEKERIYKQQYNEQHDSYQKIFDAINVDI